MTHLVHLTPLLFEPGDRLSREEFLALWEQMPNLKSAELIDGVVYMPSPVSYGHSKHHGDMQMLLSIYAARTRVCRASTEATWLMLNSAPQPDVAMRLFPEFGGRTDTSGELASGAPELIAEICKSSRSYDLGPKLALYQQAGVCEYITVLMKERRIEWRRLEEGSYRLLSRDTSGVFRSVEFPGLWIDEGAFWAEASDRLLAVLDAGLASAECAAFLDRLRQPRR